MCDALNISFTELEKQPAWWVDQMTEYLEQKGLAEKHRTAVEENRARNH